MLKIISTLA